MDEAEKYTQRLQAITEKRRLQEEQERAKREMEEERLRLQQLKRKSLRDQWLMDGPSSPTSSEPRSPLWGSQVQEMEQRIDKLQTESQRLAEEEEKLEQQMEDGRANAVVVEATAEAVQAVILENGQEEVEAESALLCFLCSSQSAPASALTCEDLLKPMDPPRLDQQLLGRWAFVADSLSHP